MALIIPSLRFTLFLAIMIASAPTYRSQRHLVTFICFIIRSDQMIIMCENCSAIANELTLKCRTDSV